MIDAANSLTVDTGGQEAENVAVDDDADVQHGGRRDGGISRRQ